MVRLANPPATQLGQSLLGGLSAALGAFETSAARILLVWPGRARRVRRQAPRELRMTAPPGTVPDGTAPS